MENQRVNLTQEETKAINKIVEKMIKRAHKRDKTIDVSSYGWYLNVQYKYKK